MLLQYADAERERAATVIREGQVQGHFWGIEPDDKVIGYAEVLFPHNLRLWIPEALADTRTTEQREMISKFVASYLAPLNSEAFERRAWYLGLISIPPAAVLLLGAALVWAFAGFRKVKDGSTSIDRTSGV
jgi:hypothetical protein